MRTCESVFYRVMADRDRVVLALQAIERKESDRQNQLACGLVIRFVAQYQIEHDCKLVRSVTNQTWPDVHNFFARIQEKGDVSSFVGKNDLSFQVYVVNNMKAVNYGRQTSAQPLSPRNVWESETVGRRLNFLALLKGLVVLVLFLAAVLVCAWSYKMMYVFLGFEQAAQASDKARIAKLEQDIAEIRRENTAIAEMNAKLDKRVNLLETTSSEAETMRAGKYAAAEKERNKQFEQEQETRAAAANAALKVVEDNTKELRTQVAGLVVDLSDTKTAFKQVSGDLEKASRKMSDVNNSVFPLEKKVEGLKTKVVAMNTDVEKYNNASDRLEKAGTTWMYMMIAGVVTSSLIWLACWCMVDTSVRKVKDLTTLSVSHSNLAARLAVLEKENAMPVREAPAQRRSRGRANPVAVPDGPDN